MNNLFQICLLYLQNFEINQKIANDFSSMAKTPLLLFNLCKYVLMSIGILLIITLTAITVYKKIRAKNKQIFRSHDADEQQRLDVNETTPLLIE